MCGCAEALVRAVVAFFDAFLVDCFLFWFRRCRPLPRPRQPRLRPPGSARAQGLDRGGAPGLGRRERCPGFLGFAESTLSNQQMAMTQMRSLGERQHGESSTGIVGHPLRGCV
ncbi:uncharacterized protein LOC119332647 isoform X2 [Triticum dicoccoides]|uniref:uncharacterized protein LOC119332647 isoform X2 n=1 Tax=Triticum dicoccoides TaxID=85692 RepID=UPI001890EB4D|nr:uncharacterized protein LOC119332647 isoform X2 [Triticum dicoccoides]XP_044425822.1 uncharacterized protein LOC123150090 isoform X2 [Triticum aestivum]